MSRLTLKYLTGNLQHQLCTKSTWGLFLLHTQLYIFKGNPIWTPDNIAVIPVLQFHEMFSTRCTWGHQYVTGMTYLLRKRNKELGKNNPTNKQNHPTSIICMQSPTYTQSSANLLATDVTHNHRSTRGEAQFRPLSSQTQINPQVSFMCRNSLEFCDCPCPLGKHLSLSDCTTLDPTISFRPWQDKYWGRFTTLLPNGSLALLKLCLLLSEQAHHSNTQLSSSKEHITG